MTIGIRNHEIAALALHQFYRSVISGSILGNILLEDDLVCADANLAGSGSNSIDMCLIIGDCLIANADHADLHGRRIDCLRGSGFLCCCRC